MGTRVVVSIAVTAGVVLSMAVTGGRAVAATSPVSAAPAVAPALRSWTGSAGTFTLADGARIVLGDPALVGEATTFGEDLSQIVGHRVPVVVGLAARSGDIRLGLGSAAPGNAEGYRLRVGDVVSLEAENTTGLGHGEQTVEQMFDLDPSHSRLPRGAAADWPLAGSAA